MATSTVEDYLKAIYREEQGSSGSRVATGRIAQALGVTPGTATTMIKTLADAGLVDHEPYAGVRLTEAGVRLARHVLRRHRLVELFLVEVMGLSWSDVHGEAEVLEHAVSDRIIDRMDEMLGRPAVDPHGDPIPTVHGTYPKGVGQRPLTESVPGARATIARVIDQHPDFLRWLEDHGVKPGREVALAARDDAADTVEITTDRGSVLRLARRAASCILVADPEPGQEAP